MLPDLLNGLFEALGGLMILNHCRVLFKDKEVKGVSILSTCFFTSWGLWNLFYYPHLDQWWSFAGGVVIVCANALWITLMLWYSDFLKGIIELTILPKSPPIRSYTAEEYRALMAAAFQTGWAAENIGKRSCAYEEHSGLNACAPGERNCKIQSCRRDAFLARDTYHD